MIFAHVFMDIGAPWSTIRIIIAERAFEKRSPLAPATHMLPQFIATNKGTSAVVSTNKLLGRRETAPSPTIVPQWIEFFRNRRQPNVARINIYNK